MQSIKGAVCEKSWFFSPSVPERHYLTSEEWNQNLNFLTNITFKASDTFATGDLRINDMIKEKLIMLRFYYLDSRELRTWISSWMFLKSLIKISGLFWIACIFSVIIKSYARHHDCLHGLLMISPTKTLNQICGDVVGNLQFVHPHLH